MDERQEKKKLRRELSALLATDDDWHKNPDSELYKQITELGKKLSSTEIKKKEQILLRNGPIDKEQFLKLREKGTSYKQIAEILNVSYKRLVQWRRDNGL